MREKTNPNAIDPAEVAKKTGLSVSKTRQVVIKAQHDDRLGDGHPLAY